MVSTILDSSKIENLKTLHMNLSCSTSQKCLISAAIFVSNLEDLCYSIDTLRDIVRDENIVISIVIRSVFKLRTSHWSIPLQRSDWLRGAWVLKTFWRKSFFPMLIFNEETACSTYPFKYDEKIVWFPNNFLRNVARLPQKQTEGSSLPDFFIGIDVDLVPSPPHHGPPSSTSTTWWYWWLSRI